MEREDTKRLPFASTGLIGGEGRSEAGGVYGKTKKGRI